MGDRLTKEREEEIRARLEIGRLPVLGTALDVVAELLAELDALRDAPPTTYQHADGTEEPIGELVARLTRERDAHSARNRAATQAIVDAIGSVGPESVEDAAPRIVARVRELEADQAQAAQAVVDAQACEMAFKERAERAEARVLELEAERDHKEEALLDAVRTVGELQASLADTRAQLARLREAAGAYLTAVSDGQADTLDPHPDVVRAYDAAERALRAALSTPGPTLAEIERGARVSALEEARAILLKAARDGRARANVDSSRRSTHAAWCRGLVDAADAVGAIFGRLGPFDEIEKEGGR